MTVALHEPSSNSTMSADQRTGGRHFMHDVRDRILHEGRGVVEEPDLHALRGRPCSARGIIFLIPSTTSRVEASVLFITTMMTVCLPFTRTAFCCTRPMSCTVATSRR